jgi:hypothetical protein
MKKFKIASYKINEYDKLIDFYVEIYSNYEENINSKSIKEKLFEQGYTYKKIKNLLFKIKKDDTSANDIIIEKIKNIYFFKYSKYEIEVKFNKHNLSYQIRESSNFMDYVEKFKEPDTFQEVLNLNDFDFDNHNIVEFKF